MIEYKSRWQSSWIRDRKCTYLLAKKYVTRIALCFVRQKMYSVPFIDSATHLANFDKKVYKPQSRSYGRIGAKMQLFYEYLMSLHTSISASRLILGSEGLQGTDALNKFSSKLLTLTPREGL